MKYAASGFSCSSRAPKVFSTVPSLTAWLPVGGGPEFLHEPLGAEDGGELGPEDLDGDLAVVLEVLGQVDRGHAAAANLALDRVVVGEGGPQPPEEIGHHPPSPVSLRLR